MPDYGHDVEFGLFPTPDAASLPRLLELVQLAEVGGLDTVSIQDHPYQRRHLDAWTLLSFLGARTSTIRLSPNVVNLPLRTPVVLAKSAATLDVLTGGRVELGLGSGAFWDAIVAAGGPRRTPGEAIAALTEAIQIIRAFFSGESVVLDGEHYSAHGLRPGPLPAHPIPIWIGAYRPRMLRLVGRLADAWVPSMGYAGPEALAEMNRLIDEAALSAGRSPEQVRRHYNIAGRFGTGSGLLQGTPHDWAEQLAELTLTEGMSTFILGSDDPDQIRRYADEVAPLVRELVAVARASADAAPGRDTGAARRTPEVAASTAPVETFSTPFTDAASEATTRRAPTSSTARLGVSPTPDDGRRLTGVLAWDEPSRPTHRGPADSAYPHAGAAQHLVDVHAGLRAELSQVRDIIDQVRRGHLEVGAARSAINAMTMRQNNWTLGAYCESYCRVVTTHHTIEDESIFPHLRRREPELEAVLDRLEEEHHVIHDVLNRLDKALVALVTDPVGAPVDHPVGEATRHPEQARTSAALVALQEAVDLLTDTLLSHLSYEERELLEPLGRHGFH